MNYQQYDIIEQMKDWIKSPIVARVDNRHFVNSAEDYQQKAEVYFRTQQPVCTIY